MRRSPDRALQQLSDLVLQHPIGRQTDRITHALAYNLGNFMRTLAIPKTAEPWSLTSLREKLIKIGAKVVSHGRYTAFQMAEAGAPRRREEEIW